MDFTPTGVHARTRGPQLRAFGGNIESGGEAYLWEVKLSGGAGLTNHKLAPLPVLLLFLGLLSYEVSQQQTPATLQLPVPCLPL